MSLGVVGFLVDPGGLRGGAPPATEQRAALLSDSRVAAIQIRRVGDTSKQLDRVEAAAGNRPEAGQVVEPMEEELAPIAGSRTDVRDGLVLGCHGDLRIENDEVRSPPDGDPIEFPKERVIKWGDAGSMRHPDRTAPEYACSSPSQILNFPTTPVY